MGGVEAVIVAAGFVIVGYHGFALTAAWVPQANFMYTGLGFLLAPLVQHAHRASILTARPLLYIGKISYGLYIWHLLAFTIGHRLPLNLVL
jgi:peptidoglycan/LPS O-acetylase OafA/YrhL